MLNTVVNYMLRYDQYSFPTIFVGELAAVPRRGTGYGPDLGPAFVISERWFPYGCFMWGRKHADRGGRVQASRTQTKVHFSSLTYYFRPYRLFLTTQTKPTQVGKTLRGFF